MYNIKILQVIGIITDDGVIKSRVEKLNDFKPHYEVFPGEEKRWRWNYYFGFFVSELGTNISRCEIVKIKNYLNKKYGIVFDKKLKYDQFSTLKNLKIKIKEGSMNTYETTDYHLACFLEVRLNNLCELIKKPGDDKKFIFEFDNTENKTIILVKEYHNNGEIKIIDFKNKLRDMKSRMINFSNMN